MLFPGRGSDQSEDDIADDQGGAVGQGNGQGRRVQVHGDVIDDVMVEVSGAGEDIPAIPAKESSEHDAESAEHEGSKGDKPAGEYPSFFLQSVVDSLQGEVSHQQAGSGAGKEHGEYVPFGHVDARPGMDEIGEDIGGVGKEKKPEKKGDQGGQVPGAFHTDSEGGAAGKGESGKKQVPEQGKAQHILSENGSIDNEGCAPEEHEDDGDRTAVLA